MRRGGTHPRFWGRRFRFPCDSSYICHPFPLFAPAMRQIRHLIEAIDPSFRVEHLRLVDVYWSFKVRPPMLINKHKAHLQKNVFEPFKRSADGFYTMARKEKRLRSLYFGCLDRRCATSPLVLPQPLLWALSEVQGVEVTMAPWELVQGVCFFRPKGGAVAKASLLWWLRGMPEEGLYELLHYAGYKIDNEDALYALFAEGLPRSESFRWWLINPDIRGYEHVKRKDRLAKKPYIRAQLRAGKSFTGAPRKSYGYRGVTFYNAGIKESWLRNRVSFPHRKLRNAARSGLAKVEKPDWWE